MDNKINDYDKFMTFKNFSWNKKEYYSLIEYLINIKDEKYKNFHQSLITNVTYDMYGVRVPALRQIAKNIYANSDYDVFLKAVTNNSYEEKMLHGFVIGNIKKDIRKIIKYVDEFVPLIDSWAICDTFVSSLKITKKNKENKEKMLELVKKYITSDKEFEIRFVIVMLMSYYLDTDESIKYVIEKLKHITCDKYYVNMAIAWCIASIFTKNVELGKDILIYEKKNNLDIYNKSCQKVRDSYRVDNSAIQEI